METENPKPKIFFASDHVGFEMKNALMVFVKELDFEVIDLGPEEIDPNDDYPLFVEKAGIEIFKNPKNSKAIVLGGSGQGEAIVANRFPNVRAVVFYGYSLDVVRLSREHNDSNILSIGVRFLSVEKAKEAVELWLKTEFSGDDRHIRRLKEIDELEKSLYLNP